jgi:site-specific recombinase XerD
LHSPEHLGWCAEIRAVPFKKTFQPALGYLEKDEMDAIIDSHDPRTPLGRRDRALLLFLYNAGARAGEAASLTVSNLDLGRRAAVKIRGKGNKPRTCPLWPATAEALAPLVDGRAPDEHVFMGRRGEPLSRFGIHLLVRRAAAEACKLCPSLQGKRVVPHTIRHTTAVHLLRAGVDINTIRAWLGHVSIETTNIYAEVDLEMKAQALARCEVQGSANPASAQPMKGGGLMDFLRSLRPAGPPGYVEPAEPNSTKLRAPIVRRHITGGIT